MIHTQDNIRYAHNEKKDLLTIADRVAHTALEVTCPFCDSKPGVPCKNGNLFMSKLSVHMERQEAAL